MMMLKHCNLTTLEAYTTPGLFLCIKVSVLLLSQSSLGVSVTYIMTDKSLVPHLQKEGLR